MREIFQLHYHHTLWSCHKGANCMHLSLGSMPDPLPKSCSLTQLL